MGNDFWIVVGWWGTLFLFGAVAFPLTKRLFGPPGGRWYDQGYFFSKAVGMATVTWIVYVLGTLRVLPFSVVSIGVALGVVFLVGAGLLLRDRGDKVSRSEIPLRGRNRRNRGDKGWKTTFLVLVIEEVFFFGALLLWSWVKGHEPSIRGLEKFMDYGFMKSILESQYFPPRDMWYAGFPINYYYFGHMVVAVLTKLSGIDLGFTFNLMLATIFAFTLTMSFSTGYQISQIGQIRQIWRIVAGVLTAFLVTMAGNMQTLYAFTRGYTSDNVKPFWELGWKIPLRQASLPAWQGFVGQVGEMWGKLGEGLNTYWYANATRFIPFTIHEFPSYSFVVSDVHGHVLSLPFVLLAIGLLIAIYTRDSGNWGHRGNWEKIIFYGFLVGVLLMTNALDGPIYLALLGATLTVHSLQFTVHSWKRWKTITVTMMFVIITAVATSLPFLWYFKSFVNGLAVNCPPGFLANSTIGPILFEGVEKCQKSPLWMMALLWGFFWFCGGWLITLGIKYQRFNIKNTLKISNISKHLSTNFFHIETLLVIFFVFALMLIIFPEFFYFKDIYPAHFRSNTMFKLGYQAFILFSIVSGYTIVTMMRVGRSVHNEKSQIPNPKSQTISKFKILNSKRLFYIFLLPQLFLVSIYPIFSVRSYFNSLREYKGLYGLTWLEEEYPDDWKAMEWLNGEVVDRQQGSPTSPKARGATITGLPVIVEADGDSYTDYNHFSAFTGIPTIVGWAVHEWLWRGGYDHVAPRREEVRQIYESSDEVMVRSILTKYHVRYIVVGTLERKKFTNLTEETLQVIAPPVFRSGTTVIYELPNTSVKPTQVGA